MLRRQQVHFEQEEQQEAIHQRQLQQQQQQQNHHLPLPQQNAADQRSGQHDISSGFLQQPSSIPTTSSASSLFPYRASPFDQWSGLSGEEREEREEEDKEEEEKEGSMSSLSPGATATATAATAIASKEATTSPLYASVLPLSTASLVFQSNQHARIPDRDNQWSPFSHQDELERIGLALHRGQGNDEEEDGMDYEMEDGSSPWSWRHPSMSSLFEDEEDEEGNDHSTNPNSLTSPHSSYLNHHHHVLHHCSLGPLGKDHPYPHHPSTSSSPSSLPTSSPEQQQQQQYVFHLHHHHHNQQQLHNQQQQQQTHALYASPFLPLPSHSHIYPYPYEDVLDSQYRDRYDASRAQEDWLDAVLGDLMEDEEDEDEDEDDDDDVDELDDALDGAFGDDQDDAQPNHQDSSSLTHNERDAVNSTVAREREQTAPNIHYGHVSIGDGEHEPFLEEHDQAAPQDLPLPLSNQGSSSTQYICRRARGSIGGVVERASRGPYHDTFEDGETRTKDDESMWVDSDHSAQTPPYILLGDPSSHLHTQHQHLLNRQRHHSCSCPPQTLRDRHHDAANQSGGVVGLPQLQTQEQKNIMHIGHVPSSSSSSDHAAPQPQHQPMDREDHEREARFARFTQELKQEQQQQQQQLGLASSAKRGIPPPPPPPPPPRKAKSKTIKIAKPVAFSRPLMRSFAPEQPAEIEIGIATPMRYHSLVILDDAACGYVGKIPSPLSTPSSPPSLPPAPPALSRTSPTKLAIVTVVE
ncbi:hypothetical protein BGZ73_007508 [Actinomortierella ambigua]|nr:hypothetical protein BGZ73_007508 [Actinomortierella ambigua]